MFDTFESRLTIQGYIVSQAALRVGIGRVSEMTGTELPVIRDSLDRPYIPGSSFKGALRSYLESMVRGMAPPGVDLRRLACNPVSNSGEECCLSAGEMRDLLTQHNDDEELAQAVSAALCLVCSTFGSPYLASTVQIRDLPTVAEEWIGQFQVRDGVAIDRDKGTVAGKQLYDYEVVPAGTRFQLHLVADNLTPWQRGLLWIGIRALERGDVALGGFTGRGLGWVRLEERESDFIDGSESLLALLGGKEAGRSVGDEEAKSWVSALQAEVARRKGGQDA
jgi:CRISPR-associated RAMP protein (TIGR02581 family)